MKEYMQLLKEKYIKRENGYIYIIIGKDTDP